MKLYELPAKSYFIVGTDPHFQVFFLDHIDGMYSYCKNKEGTIIHISASAEVTPHETDFTQQG